jgi:NADH dehydrogenase/NADH:ubiquinone oxidoreductase 75 kD subunit (chain G)
MPRCELVENRKHFIGIHLFDVMVRPLGGGLAEFRFGADGHAKKPLAVAGRRPVDEALQDLADAWKDIAGEHAGATGGRVDIGALGGGEPGTMVLSWPGPSLAVEGNDRAPIDLGRNSVIVVEVLKSLGDLLATVAGEGPRQAWESASAATDLPPFEIKDGDWKDIGPDAFEMAAWYARKLGIDPDTFAYGAIMLHARHLQWAVDRSGEEATVERQNPYTWAPVGREEAMRAVAEVAPHFHETEAEMVDSALFGAIGNARARVIFGKEPWAGPEGASPSP